MGSAACPTPKGDASQMTIGFAPMVNAERAVAFTTSGSLSVSAVMMSVSPGWRLNNSLVSVSAALPNSNSYNVMTLASSLSGSPVHSLLTLPRPHG